MRAGKGRGAEQAPAEARAFLVRPIHQANRDGRPAVEVLCQAAQHLESGENAKGAIQPTAIGNGVKMTAQDESPLRITLQSRPGIAGGVKVMLHRQPRQFALKPGASLEPGWSPGNPLRSVVVRGQRTKLPQIGDSSARIDRHGVSLLARFALVDHTTFHHEVHMLQHAHIVKRVSFHRDHVGPMARLESSRRALHSTWRDKTMGGIHGCLFAALTAGRDAEGIAKPQLPPTVPAVSEQCRPAHAV